MMTSSSDFKTRLDALSRERGFSLFGVADITGIRGGFNLDPETTARFPRAVSLGKRLLDSVIDDIPDHPTQLYFHHYRQINFFLDREALTLADRIQEWGFQAFPIAASQILDWDKQTAHVPHKKIGELAGLGWMGRSNLLVNPRYGARFRLVSILTDLPLEPDHPLDEDCGECIQCLKTCPAGAIKERRQDFDHIGCYEQLKAFRKQGYVSQFICGVCIKACPGREKERR